MKKIFITTTALLIACTLSAADLFVSPKGNDRNPGTKDSPKATLTAALRQARELRRLNDESLKGGITIHMEAGDYHLYEPVFIRPEDSGTEASPTVITSDGNAILNGGVEIRNWKKQGKLWVADVPMFNGRPLDFRQLWINGQKAVRARDVADFEKMYRIINNDPQNEILWVPAAAVKKIQKARYAEMVLHEMWCVANLRIKSVEIQGDSAAVRFHNPESRIQFEHPWPRPMVTKDGHNSAFYLTNAMELLDEPGEWYHDIESRKIYYYPRKGEKISKAVVPGIETLVWVEGTIDRPVKHIRFDNVTFQYTTWMRPSLQGHVPLQAGMYMTDGYKIRPSMIRKNNHKLDNQGWLGRPASAVVVKAAQDIDFEKCRFQHLGSTGIDYEWATGGGRINGCLFRDIAGNGIVAGSFSPAAHETHLPYDPADRREVCTGLTISNNYINDVTNEDWGTLGICAGYVSDINIEHNEISDVSYSGISLGWGWTRTVNCMRNNRVHANLIHHYAKHMYDVAGIYTLGSQPHSWITENCVSNIFSPGYAHDPNHWFYLYTDEGSSFITVKDNWTEGEKFLKNANGPGNTWENNGPMVNDSIKANAGLTKEYSYCPISSTTGFQNYLGNLGQLNNRGWELELRTINFAGSNFNWTSVLNMTHNKNKIVSLDGKLEQSIEGSWFIHKVGLPYSTFYVKEYAGVDPQTGKALYYMNTQDANGNYDKTVTTDASAAQAIPYKSVDPKISGGFTNIVNYKWFDLALTLTYSLGGYSFDKTGTYNETDGAKEQNYNLPIYELDRWQKPGDVTDVPRFVLGQAAGPQNSSRYVHSTDHLRVKNLTLGFTLPDQWLTKLGVSKARLYFSGSNLLTWAKWDQYDPEVPVSGEVFCETPPMRTYSFGIEVSF